MLTVSEMKKQVFKAENMQNLFHRDTEGFSFPANPADFYTLDSGSTNRKWGWFASGKCLFGQGPSNFRQIAPFDGGSASYSGGAFGEAIKPVNCSVLATIGGANYGWSDTDGTRQVISGRVIGVGMTGTSSFTLNVGTASVDESTFVLTHTEGGNVRTATSTGGVISGTNVASGTLDVATGVVVVTFTVEPDDGTNILAGYTVDSLMDLEHSETLAIGNGTTTVYGALSTDYGNIRANSVRIAATISGTVRYFVDDGLGALTGLVAGTLTVGTVNPTTGAIAMTFATAPDLNTDITITYCRIGLNKSTINYGTGGSIALDFDVGSEPDALTKIVLTGSAVAITEFPGIDVETGLLCVGLTGGVAGFRTARSYLDTGSEDYSGDNATIHALPGTRHVLSFYGKTTSGTAKCYIRAWTGGVTNTQVSIDASMIDWKVLTGVVTRVADPLDGTKFCLQCDITTTLERFGAYVMCPPTAYCLSLEWVGDVTCTYAGEQSLWITGIASGTGTELPAYAPNTAIFSLARPRNNPLGRSGEVYVTDGEGGGNWTPLTTAGGAGITQLNGLSAGVQTFGVGTAGTAPAIVSAGSSHTINIPSAATVGVTGGTISKADYDEFKNAAAGGALTVSLSPSVDDTLSVGTSSNRWAEIHGVEGHFNTLGDTTNTMTNGGVLNLAQALQGNLGSGLELANNAYDSNVGFVRSDTNTAGVVLRADATSLTVSFSEGGDASNAAPLPALGITAGLLALGRSAKAWVANRLTDVALRLRHPVQSDYDKNFASPGYDTETGPLFTLRGVTAGTGKGPVIAFARAESATLPIGGIWAKTAAAGSGLDKFSFLTATNDTSWPSEVASIDKSGNATFSNVGCVDMTATGIVSGASVSTAGAISGGAVSCTSLTVGGQPVRQSIEVPQILAYLSIPNFYISEPAMDPSWGVASSSDSVCCAYNPGYGPSFVPAYGGGYGGGSPRISVPSAAYYNMAVSAYTGKVFIVPDSSGIYVAYYNSNYLTAFGATGFSGWTASTGYTDMYSRNSALGYKLGSICVASDDSILAYIRGANSMQIITSTNMGATLTINNMGLNLYMAGTGVDRVFTREAANNGNIKVVKSSEITPVTLPFSLYNAGSSASCVVGPTPTRTVALDTYGQIQVLTNYASPVVVNGGTHTNLFMSPSGEYIVGLRPSYNDIYAISRDYGATWQVSSNPIPTVSGGLTAGFCVLDCGVLIIGGNSASATGMATVLLGSESENSYVYWPYTQTGLYTQSTYLNKTATASLSYLYQVGCTLFHRSAAGVLVAKKSMRYHPRYPSPQVFSGSLAIGFTAIQATGYNTPAFTWIYRTADTATTWARVTSAGRRKWSALACSSDGLKVVALARGEGVYLSNDSGTTWSQVDTSSGTSSGGVAMNAAGDYILVADFKTINVVRLSSDGGANWATIPGLAVAVTGSVMAISPSGKAMVIFSNGSHVFGSLDYGVTWVKSRLPPSVHTDQNDVGLTDEGSYVVASTNTNQAIRLKIGVAGGWFVNESVVPSSSAALSGVTQDSRGILAIGVYRENSAGQVYNAQHSAYSSIPLE